MHGEANVEPMTAAMALRLGQAAGRFFTTGNHGHRVVIGKDTRRSGYMLENALTAGFTSVGMDVFLLGPVPTPAVGFLTRSMRADLGVMISASHNPFQDNGIKFFGPDGFKLSDAAEEVIEGFLEDAPALAPSAGIGRATRIDDGRGRYIEFAKTSFPRGQRLEGLKVVVDCANGAAYRTAPDVLWELGAEVIPVGVRPDGFNINKSCGSTHPRTAIEAVVAHGADLGISLDGDADRVMIIDETGAGRGRRPVHGADCRAMGGSRKAGAWNAGRDGDVQSRPRAASGGARAETCPDQGRRSLCRRGNAGGGFNLGGEQSGHIVMTDHVTTGDGLIAALQFLSAMVETGRPASELARVFTAFPQKLVNVRHERGAAPLEVESVKRAMSAGRRTSPGGVGW